MQYVLLRKKISSDTLSILFVRVKEKLTNQMLETEGKRGREDKIKQNQTK